MIQYTLKFDERSISTALLNRKYLLEVVANKDFDGIEDIPSICFQISDMKLGGQAYSAFECLRICQPSTIVEFSGFVNKFREQDIYWYSVIKLVPFSASKHKEFFFCLVGYDIQTRGKLVSIVSVGHKKEQIIDDFDKLVKERLGRNYKLSFSLKNIINSVPITLPKISGLPKIEDVYPADNPFSMIPSSVRVIPSSEPWFISTETTTKEELEKIEESSDEIPFPFEDISVGEEPRKDSFEEDKSIVVPKELSLSDEKQKIKNMKKLMSSRKNEDSW